MPPEVPNTESRGEMGDGCVPEKEAQWERTFDAVPDMISVVDQHYQILRVNQATVDRLGIPREKCQGMFCYRLIHGTDTPPEECPHRRFLMDGQTHSAEVHDERLNADFLVSVTPLADCEGRTVGCVHVARDITDLRHRQREREGTLALLRLLNDRNHTHELIRQITDYLQQWTGCEAVGVRLCEGEDFPYFVSVAGSTFFSFGRLRRVAFYGTAEFSM